MAATWLHATNLHYTLNFSLLSEVCTLSVWLLSLFLLGVLAAAAASGVEIERHTRPFSAGTMLSEACDKACVASHRYVRLGLGCSYKTFYKRIN